MRTYTAEQRENNRIRANKYLQENKEVVSSKKKEYYRKNRATIREKQNTYYNAQYREAITSWIGFIPPEAICQICGALVCFGKQKSSDAIHFDHKNGGAEIIKGTPTTWLCRNKRTPEKEKIWESCHFGILCKKCNSFLPTKNRSDFLRRVIEYVK